MLTILALVNTAHDNARIHGFWDDVEQLKVTLTPRQCENLDHIIYGQKIALIHSELSESLEGDRKNLPDDHLPEYQMKFIELADAMIRIADLAGYLGIDLEAAIIAKMEYNKSRPFKHGKAY
jgi:NTP pyrophosphatase (non-canonical NTP hydrolase)